MIGSRSERTPGSSSDSVPSKVALGGSSHLLGVAPGNSSQERAIPWAVLIIGTITLVFVAGFADPPAALIVLALFALIAAILYVVQEKKWGQVVGYVRAIPLPEFPHRAANGPPDQPTIPPPALLTPPICPQCGLQAEMGQVQCSKCGATLTSGAATTGATPA
jgi:hypothetical protein